MNAKFSYVINILRLRCTGICTSSVNNYCWNGLAEWLYRTQKWASLLSLFKHHVAKYNANNSSLYFKMHFLCVAVGAMIWHSCPSPTFSVISCFLLLKLFIFLNICCPNFPNGTFGKFCENSFITFKVILLTNNKARQKWQKHI